MENNKIANKLCSDIASSEHSSFLQKIKDPYFLIYWILFSTVSVIVAKLEYDLNGSLGYAITMGIGLFLIGVHHYFVMIAELIIIPEIYEGDAEEVGFHNFRLNDKEIAHIFEREFYEKEKCKN